jgi:adenylate kinase family enzyme
VRQVVVIGSASGNGKTTFARELATRLEAPFHELDALVHGPGWVETPDDVLRGQVEQILAGDAWVIDGSYRGKLGTLVLDAADTIVWLDLPLVVWLPRLVRRTFRRIRRREELWNGNRETFRSAFWGRESLVIFALRSHVRRRRDYPAALAGYRVTRLRTRAAVAEFLDSV